MNENLRKAEREMFEMMFGEEEANRIEKLPHFSQNIEYSEKTPERIKHQINTKNKINHKLSDNDIKIDEQSNEIDIFKKDRIKDDEIRYLNSINHKVIEQYVSEKIDFFVSDNLWLLIHKYFGEFWNNKIGIGGYFYYDEIAKYIYDQLTKKKYLIEENRINIIVELILDKIHIDGGFLE